MIKIFCNIHQDVETRLSCVSCGKSICPKCMIEAAVGFKCPECARAKKTHIEEITPKNYLTGGLAGVIIGAGAGFIWYNLSMFGVLVNLLVAYAVGFCISKAIALSIGNKIGIKIQIFAGAIAFISMVYNPIVIMSYVAGDQSFLPVILVMSTLSLFSMIKLLAVVLAVWAAVRHFKI